MMNQNNSQQNLKNLINKRVNYSDPGKKMDQIFYQNGVIKVSKAERIQKPEKKKKMTSLSYAFSAIGRNKMPNLRQSMCGLEKLKINPNYFFIKNRSPAYSIPKLTSKDRDQRQDIIQICNKHPVSHALRTKQKKAKQENSIDDRNDDNINIKNTILESTAMRSKQFPLSQRKKSEISDFSPLKNKIRLPRSSLEYEQNDQSTAILQQIKQKDTCRKGYVQFSLRKTREKLKRTKGHEIFVPFHQNQERYNNFYLSKHPKNPYYALDFSKKLAKIKKKEIKGPNLERVNIDFTRVNQSCIDLNINKRKIFQNKNLILQASRKIQYDIPNNDHIQSFSMRLKPERSEQLFPVSHRSIKKIGDQQLKDVLQHEFFSMDINEALKRRYVPI